MKVLSGKMYFDPIIGKSMHHKRVPIRLCLDSVAQRVEGDFDYACCKRYAHSWMGKKGVSQALYLITLQTSFTFDNDGVG